MSKPIQVAQASPQAPQILGGAEFVGSNVKHNTAHLWFKGSEADVQRIQKILEQDMATEKLFPQAKNEAGLIGGGEGDVQKPGHRTLTFTVPDSQAAVFQKTMDRIRDQLNPSQLQNIPDNRTDIKRQGLFRPGGLNLG